MQQRRRTTITGQVVPPFRVPAAEQPAGPPARRPQAPADAAQAAPVPEEGLYIISVAARILRMHPQTLRKYERVGLVRPSRTVGMLRLYSERDIAKLRMIKHLVDEMRLNLAGVEMAMAVFDRLTTAMEASQAPVTRPARAAMPFEQAMQDIMEMFLGTSRQASRRPGER
ncbi:MAG: MerR family transcriptional regulator [Chloroflexota bacterium]|nr:MerR family transcriptional regulator [Chloroflexota bacterium]MDE2885637.1 MerR family transcriptional regulator [Chloroflexota bacterium]